MQSSSQQRAAVGDHPRLQARADDRYDDVAGPQIDLRSDGKLRAAAGRSAAAGVLAGQDGMPGRVGAGADGAKQLQLSGAGQVGDGHGGDRPERLSCGGDGGE